jgi:hypothetical protein
MWGNRVCLGEEEELESVPRRRGKRISRGERGGKGAVQRRRVNRVSPGEDEKQVQSKEGGGTRLV